MPAPSRERVSPAGVGRVKRDAPEGGGGPLVRTTEFHPLRAKPYAETDGARYRIEMRAGR